MSDYPVIHVPPCDELDIVVADLYPRLVSGALTALPASWRADLETLKSLCKNASPATTEHLTALLALPNKPVDET